MRHGLLSIKSTWFLPVTFMHTNDQYANFPFYYHLFWNYSLIFNSVDAYKQLLNLYLQERVSNIAYNVVNGLCIPVDDLSAPVYITIGDGGNLEGLATK